MLLSDKPVNVEKSIKVDNKPADITGQIQASDNIQSIVAQLNKELSFGDQQKQEGPKAKFAAKEIRKTSKYTILEQTVKDYLKEIKNRKIDLTKNTNEEEKKQVEELTKRILKSFAVEDVKRANDILTLQQVQNDEQQTLKKKKEADLDFQRNNNEYGLQEMATEERDKNKEKLKKQQEQDESEVKSAAL